VSRYLHTSYTGRCWCDAEGVTSRLPQMVEGREDVRSGSEKLDSEILTDEQWSGRALATAPSILCRPQSIKCGRTPIENSGSQLKLRESVAPAFITSPKDLRFCFVRKRLTLTPASTGRPCLPWVIDQSSILGDGSYMKRSCLLPHRYGEAYGRRANSLLRFCNPRVRTEPGERELLPCWRGDRRVRLSCEHC
jgi:hypothetical protein